MKRQQYNIMEQNKNEITDTVTCNNLFGFKMKFVYQVNFVSSPNNK